MKVQEAQNRIKEAQNRIKEAQEVLLMDKMMMQHLFLMRNQRQSQIKQVPKKVSPLKE